MTDESNIQPLQPDFEQIKKRAEDGKEYWSARDLSTVLGYSTWQKFNRVLNKALQVAQNKGMDMGEHFNQVVEMVKLGSGTFREVDNFHLSRLACLIIAENADGKKSQVQAARIYFKEQTPLLELVENQISSRVLIYKTNQGETRVEVLFNGRTFWLTQKRMADLYDVDVSTVNYHLGNILETGELKESAVIRKIPITAADGKDYDTMIYNLDAIIAVGYRVNSYKATQFRIWATEVLREFIIKGFVLDDERLKQGKHFGQDYFDDLLERIREIRTSERRYYQKITDVYAECSADYDPKSETTQLFFKIVQNMMHWAVTHQTAAEIIYNRADAEQPHMGLTTWKNAPEGRVQKSDTTVAKNYLSDKEVTALNRISNAFLDLAEDRADRQLLTTMAEWKEQLERFLGMYNYEVLEGAGTVTVEEAKEKAYEEYDKFRLIQDREYLSDFDKEVRNWKQLGLFDDDNK
jgi:hypothetical protein